MRNDHLNERPQVASPNGLPVAQRMDLDDVADSPAANDTLIAFINDAPTSMAMFDASMRYLAVSRRWRHAYALGERPLVGHSHYDIFPDLPQSWNTVHQRVLAGETLSAEQERWERADGTTSYIRWECRPWRTPAGAVGGVIVFTEDVTACVYAEQQLRESEQRFRSLVMTSTQIIWRTDAQGRPIDEAPGWRAFTGQGEVERKNGDWVDCIHPDDREPTVKAWRRAVEGREPYTAEYRTRRHDGVYRWTLARGVPIRDPDGTVREWVGTNADITERYEIEQRLRDREHRLSLAFDAAGMAAWTFDPETGDAEWDDDLERIIGLPCGGPGSKCAQEFFDCVHPDDLPNINSDIQRVMTDGAGYRHEFRFRRPDGRWIWLAGRAIAVTERADGRRTLVGVNFDITARKDAEMALRLRDRAIEASDAGILIVDALTPDMPLVYASDGFERMTGYTQAEVVGRNCRFLQGPQTDPGQVRRLHDAITRGRPCRVTVLNYRKDGKPFWNDIAIAPVRDEQGRITNYVGVQNDVTEMIESGAALTLSKDRLRLGMQVAGVSLSEIDYTTGMNHLSAEAAKLFGIGDAAVSVPRDRVHATFHPDDVPELRERIADCLNPAGRGWFAMEHRLVHPDGDVRWVSVRKQVRFEGEGEQRRPVTATLAAIDISDRVAYTEAIRIGQARLQMTMAAANIYSWDMDVISGRIEFGQNHEAIVGFALPDDLDRIKEGA